MKRDEVILSVDTHLNLHVGALINNTGKCLGTLSVPTNAGGYLKGFDLFREIIRTSSLEHAHASSPLRPPRPCSTSSIARVKRSHSLVFSISRSRPFAVNE